MHLRKQYIIKNNKILFRYKLQDHLGAEGHKENQEVERLQGCPVSRAHSTKWCWKLMKHITRTCFDFCSKNFKLI